MPGAVLGRRGWRSQRCYAWSGHNFWEQMCFKEMRKCADTEPGQGLTSYSSSCQYTSKHLDGEWRSEIIVNDKE